MMPVQTYVFGAIAALAAIAGLVEGVGAIYWRRRAGHWHAFRLAGVLIYTAIAAMFSAAALS